MARDKGQNDSYFGPIRNVLMGVVLVFCFGIFIIWRIDSPRVERFRTAMIDRFVPSFSILSAPMTKFAHMVDDYQSYTRIYEQNQELRRELQDMKAWKEAALQLEQKNAKLLDLNKVRLDPKLTYVTGVVLADSGSPFRRSVLLNVGARDDIVDGWATMDGLGLVGRISGVGEQTSRVVLLTDGASTIPVTIQPSGQRAILTGDNTAAPLLDFIEKPDMVRPGDRIVSSGDGGLFPAGILVGQVTQGPDGRLRTRLSADYERLEFLRVLRSHELETITDAGALLVPLAALNSPPTGLDVTAPFLPPVNAPDPRDRPADIATGAAGQAATGEIATGEMATDPATQPGTQTAPDANQDRQGPPIAPTPLNVTPGGDNG